MILISNIKKSIIKSFSDKYEIKCFEITTDYMKNFNEQHPITICEIKTLLNKKKLKNNVILAHSFGCIIALDIAHTLKICNNINIIFIEPSTFKRIKTDESSNLLLPLYEKINEIKHNITCPILIFTYYQNIKFIKKIESMDKIDYENKKIFNFEKFNSIINFLESYIEHEKEIIELVTPNPNISIIIVPEIKDKHNPHFIHVNNPEYIIEKMTEYLDNIIVNSH